jgi:uncharacterized protein with ATP-grasp and redox domains
MTWNYEPTRKETEAYLFDGPYYVTANVNDEISKEDVQTAITKVLEASIEQDGLDRIQRLVHQASGSIVWIVDNISEEYKDEIIESSPTAENDLREYDATTIMFPHDY